jgi:VanZ family protein
LIRARLALAALAYALLVAHLLFIPYVFSPLPLADTLRRFAAVPWLALGPDQNVALASRALMFFPLGLLLAAWVAPRPRRRLEWPALLVSTLLGCVWATAVNVVQLWFPTRTVSLNNLAAEFAGVIGGGLTWSALGLAATNWWQRLASGGGGGVKAALTGYVVIYLLASLTPFDFVTSSAELAAKASSGLYGWWTAPGGCGPAPCALKFLSALFAAVPCGWWLAAQQPRAKLAWLPVVLVALIVATAIELLHFLMVSGVSQGASVVVRASGMILGVATYAWRGGLAALDLDRVVRPAVLASLAPYLAAVAYVAGWSRAPKLDVASGLARMNEVVWMPFYYQYFTPYQSTMQSAIVHAALYAPVGIGFWLWARRRDRFPLWPATVLAVVIAIAAETSKLFLAGRLPDYADVLIAAVSATLAAAVLRLVSRPRQPAPSAEGAPPRGFDRGPRAAIPVAPSAPGPAEAAAGTLTIATTPAPPVARLAGLALLIVAGWGVFDFPIGSWLLALGLIGYAALVRRFPTVSYLVALPALLPVLDLAPWSGRFFWDEFDLLLAVTLGMKLLLPRPLPRADLRLPLPAAALGLLALSVAASAALALWPPAPVDANALSSYLSPYNALRVAKGYGWGGAVLWLVCRDAAAGRRVIPALHAGLVAGLIAAAASVYWERLSFLGAFDPGGAFRAAGLVSATHVGGAYLEALLVMLAPFSLALAFTAERRLLRAFGYASALLGAGAIVFTLSRAAAAAWVAAVAVFAVVLWLRSTSARAGFGSGWRRWGAGLAVAGLFGATVLVAQSSQLRERLVLSEADLALRISHWRQTLRIARADPMHVVLGMGLGAFPREFYVADAATQRLPAYRLERDAAAPGRRFLMLAGGRGMFIDQRVSAPAGSELHLRGVIRSPQGSGKLAVSLCRKSMLNSVACDEAVVNASPSWQPFDVPLAVPQRAGLRLGPGAPVSLSVHNGTSARGWRSRSCRSPAQRVNGFETDRSSRVSITGS